MGLRDRVLGWLDRGEVPEPPAGSPVEIEDVRLFEGPMLLRVLHESGIEAHGVEAAGHYTEGATLDRMRIVVRYRDAARARELLEEHRRRLRG